MHRIRSTGPRLAGALLIVTVMLLAGCSGGMETRFVDDDRDYTLAEVGGNAASIDPGSATSVKAQDAEEVRQRVLSRLRRKGELAGKAADALTKDFPPDLKAVPYYVEAADVDGKPSWIVVESWGGSDSASLSMRRLWVLGRDDGSITDSRTFR